jgi:predicted RNA-binding Zn-ribbon protein involved in translation (DUF1610 family)
MSETRPVETGEPEEAFAALSDETRVDILRALWEVEDRQATFSELREAVGVADSGQFNYHLDKLVGRFVRKTDDGYELTLAGLHVNGAIRAGAYTMAGTIEPVEIDQPCPSCGGTRTFRYEDETARIACVDCAFTLSSPIPPGVFADYDRETAPAVASRYFRTIVGQVSNGFCWYCDGPVELTVRSLAASTEADVPEELTDLPFAHFECERCGAEITGDLGSTLVDHPAVGGFYFDHGVDVRDRPFHTFNALDPDRSEIRQRDPFRASVTFSVDGDSLTLVVDEDCDVVDVERAET